MIMTSEMACINYQLKFLGKLQKVFKLRHQRQSSDEPQNKKTSEHIWQPEKCLVTSSCPFLFLITISIKNDVKFSEGFLIILFPNISFLAIYAQWVSTSTPDLKIPSSNPTNVLG